MGPLRPVDMSSSSQPESEKTARSASSKKGDSESRDISSKLKPALVPQIKSLSGSSETEDVVPPKVPAAPEHRRLCEERQRLGLKRQTLEARIARVERKIRALESDPFQWEWRNFDSVAEIPKMLRMYLRAKGVPGPVNAPVRTVPSDSEEEDEEEASTSRKRVRDRPEVDAKNKASTSKTKPAMKEPVPEPLP
ncbi:uncharacterized protein LOC110227089 [Arabidopsis lyrata subsp. lyrata]|uniref:uncharacterized protein LOC110227089 n=1 Tax=Arabidopsis lyrata subsp. lyrata TaxID=81972 RepID=UPI000A29E288|nr:uncharacterized protein LOC110227089 [Arabidopsis lyrata subsp. lyrata]|eukprot:XP_020875922.1 uncharacterized protein LOC110227089 [Arabidopsis lyrata subsp. lyrata]